MTVFLKLDLGDKEKPVAKKWYTLIPLSAILTISDIAVQGQSAIQLVGQSKDDLGLTVRATREEIEYALSTVERNQAVTIVDVDKINGKD